MFGRQGLALGRYSELGLGIWTVFRIKEIKRSVELEKLWKLGLLIIVALTGHETS